MSEAVRKGRAEAGLDRSLVERRDIPAAARAALRVLARGLDKAETLGDPELIATAGRAYFDALEANLLTATEAKPTDAFEQLLADISRPGAGALDSPPA